MRGQIVVSPSGEPIELVDVGVAQLLDNDRVRVWDVTLPPYGRHPWHLHHNPYVVLSIDGAEGRMDWLDGSPPRFISEYRGGAVYRPVSPIHRLTNLSGHQYRNRLVELKDLGEHRLQPLDVGPGCRSLPGERPGPDLADGRRPVLLHEHVRVWTVEVAPVALVELDLAELPHLLVAVDHPDLPRRAHGRVTWVEGGSTRLPNDADEPRTWFVLELTYLADLQRLVTSLGGAPRG